MLEAKGNIFNMDCDALCITTNGFVKKGELAVMGRGCAKQAADLVPELPAILGKSLNIAGNTVSILVIKNETYLVAFPVKPICEKFESNSQVVKHMQGKFTQGQLIPGWACVASMPIIEKSALELVDMVNFKGWTNVVLPRPGCGAGELSWDIVRFVLEGILDDRFTCVTF